MENNLTTLSDIKHPDRKMTITILDDDKNPIDLKAYAYKKLPSSFALWIKESNSLHMGMDIYEEWNYISGNASKQRQFLNKLVVLDPLKVNN